MDYTNSPYDLIEKKRMKNIKNKQILSDDVDKKYVLSQGVISDYDAKINDWIFTETISKYKHSYHGLYNNSNYLVRYQAYKGRYYPIIKLPKGMMLYNAVQSRAIANINSKVELYNLGKLDKTIDYDLRFFYPFPYACWGVAEYGNTYEHMNVCTLSRDMYLLCLLSPTSQTRNSMRHPHDAPVYRTKLDKDENPVLDADGNTVLDKSEYYYENKNTHECKIHSYDLCIEPEMMYELGLQGYITIATNDSISHGEMWKEVAEILSKTNATHNHIGKDVYNKMVSVSCMNSAMVTPELGDLTESETKRIENISNCSPDFQSITDESVKRRVFGIPEIVLSPFNSAFFSTPSKNTHKLTRHQIRDMFLSLEEEDYKEFMTNVCNYELIMDCSLNSSKLELWLALSEDDITHSLQCPAFNMNEDAIDPTKFLSNYMKPISEPITYEDVDYIKAYNQTVKRQGDYDKYICAFETMAYYILPKDKSKGGRLSLEQTIGKRKLSHSAKVSPVIKKMGLSTLKRGKTIHKVYQHAKTTSKSKSKSSSLQTRRRKFVAQRHAKDFVQTCVFDIPKFNVKMNMKMSKNGIPIVWTSPITLR